MKLQRQVNSVDIRLSRSRPLPVLSAVQLRGCQCAIARDVSAVCVGVLRVMVYRPKVLLTVEYCSKYQNNRELNEQYRMFIFKPGCSTFVRA